MIAYAVAFGLLQAFVIPARDGLLNSVAEGSVQRAVVKAIFVQFSVQLAGFSIAGSAEYLGGHWVILVQGAALAIGALAIRKIAPPAATPMASRPAPERLAVSIGQGYRAVMRSPEMRSVVFQNVAMGICFMGTYVVTVPLIIREVYHGSSSDLAIVNVTNSIGLVLTILVLLRLGDIRRQGRVLVVGHVIGSLALMVAALGVGFYGFAICMSFWGAAGGITISMSRTIMQEHAPSELRGRVMGFHSFSFLGVAPVGTLLWGYCVERIGPEHSMLVAAALMLVVIVMVAKGFGLWNVQSPPETPSRSS